MHQRVLLHLRRDDESYELELATRAVAPAKQHVAFRLAVAPQPSVKSSLPDTESDNVLCVHSKAPLPLATLQALRKAVHKRHGNLDDVHARLLCDLRGGDESRNCAGSLCRTVGRS